MPVYVLVLEMDDDRVDEVEWQLSMLPARLIGRVSPLQGPDELRGVLALSRQRLEVPNPSGPPGQRQASQG